MFVNKLNVLRTIVSCRLCKDNLPLCRDNLPLCRDNLPLCKDNLPLCGDNHRLCRDNLLLCGDNLLFTIVNDLLIKIDRSFKFKILLNTLTKRHYSMITKISFLRKLKTT